MGNSESTISEQQQQPETDVAPVASSPSAPGRYYSYDTARAAPPVQAPATVESKYAARGQRSPGWGAFNMDDGASEKSVSREAVAVQEKSTPPLPPRPEPEPVRPYDVSPPTDSPIQISVQSPVRSPAQSPAQSPVQSPPRTPVHAHVPVPVPAPIIPIIVHTPPELETEEEEAPLETETDDVGEQPMGSPTPPAPLAPVPHDAPHEEKHVRFAGASDESESEEEDDPPHVHPGHESHLQIMHSLETVWPGNLLEQAQVQVQDVVEAEARKLEAQREEAEEEREAIEEALERDYDPYGRSQFGSEGVPEDEDCEREHENPFEPEYAHSETSLAIPEERHTVALHSPVAMRMVESDSVASLISSSRHEGRSTYELAEGVYEIINVKAGSAMDLSGGDSKSVIGFPFHGAENQQWNFRRLGKGYAVQSAANGLYLTIEDGFGEGVQVVASEYPAAWVVETVSWMDEIEEGVFRIVWPSGRWAMKLGWGGPGAAVHLAHTDEEDAAQHWQLVSRSAKERESASAATNNSHQSVCRTTVTTQFQKDGEPVGWVGPPIVLSSRPAKQEDDHEVVETTTTTTTVTTVTTVRRAGSR